MLIKIYKTSIILYVRIKLLELNCFRNYKYARVEFDEGLNVVYGKNASGKTNLLESVFISSIFRSPRTAKDKELVLIGEPKATVRLSVEKKYRAHRIELQIDAQGKKKVAVDSIPVMRAGELLGVLGVVYFSPDELKLVKESPAERRRFLDVGLSQQQRAYFKALSRYNKTLKQKNNLLKDAKNAGSGIDGMLDVWDAGLAAEGAILTRRRLDYINTLNLCAKRIHFKLSGDSEELTLSYECGIDASAQDDNLKDELFREIVRARDKDKRLGFASVGPHRDDISIEINGQDSRKFASQGQQRTIALAMKLAEVELYTLETGEAPVLLLDDVLSELDEARREELLLASQSVQTILTCTEFPSPLGAKLFRVDKGTVSEA